MVLFPDIWEALGQCVEVCVIPILSHGNVSSSHSMVWKFVVFTLLCSSNSMVRVCVYFSDYGMGYGSLSTVWECGFLSQSVVQKCVHVHSLQYGSVCSLTLWYGSV